MKKIVIAGAGAYFFAPAIFEDLFVRFRMEAEYWMVDRSEEHTSELQSLV